MAYTYEKQLWKDYPDTTTPVTAERLNHMEDGISEAAKSGGGDTIPVGSEFDYDGTTVPEGFVQVEDPNTYSSEEVVIGTWFGKKLYRKTIDRGNSLSSFEHNIKNVESIFINNDHTYRVHTSGNCISLNASGAGSYVYVNKTTVTINNTSGASPDKVYVTLEYTKTTD